MKETETVSNVLICSLGLGSWSSRDEVREKEKGHFLNLKSLGTLK